MSSGNIAAIIVCSLVGIIFLGSAVYYLVSKKRKEVYMKNISNADSKSNQDAQKMENLAVDNVIENKDKNICVLNEMDEFNSKNNKNMDIEDKNINNDNNVIVEF